jgi:hypothetical protein
LPEPNDNFFARFPVKGESLTKPGREYLFLSKSQAPGLESPKETFKIRGFLLSLEIPS